MQLNNFFPESSQILYLARKLLLSRESYIFLFSALILEMMECLHFRAKKVAR
jgi:hypothetical protein